MRSPGIPLPPVACSLPLRPSLLNLVGAAYRAGCYAAPHCLLVISCASAVPRFLGHRSSVPLPCTHLLALWWPLRPVIRAFLEIGVLSGANRENRSWHSLKRKHRYSPGKARFRDTIVLNHLRHMCYAKALERAHIRKRFIALERLPKQKRPASNLAGRECLDDKRQAAM